MNFPTPSASRILIARRRAVEQVLLAYGLMKNTEDVSHNFEAVEETN
jgi:hypothetical protein